MVAAEAQRHGIHHPLVPGHQQTEGIHVTGLGPGDKVTLFWRSHPRFDRNRYAHRRNSWQEKAKSGSGVFEIGGGHRPSWTGGVDARSRRKSRSIPIPRRRGGGSRQSLEQPPRRFAPPLLSRRGDGRFQFQLILYPPEKNTRSTNQKAPARITTIEPAKATFFPTHSLLARSAARAELTRTTTHSWPISTPRLKENKDHPSALRGRSISRKTLANPNPWINPKANAIQARTSRPSFTRRLSKPT